MVSKSARPKPDLRRWTLVGMGVVCVALGGVGVVLPGMPTTVFLIVASWCFTRSCPWLEERLIRNKFFRPYLCFLDGKSSMPRRAMWTTLALMWAAISASTLFLHQADAALALVVSVPLAGVIGTGAVLRVARRPVLKSESPRGVCPVMPHASPTTDE